MSLLFFVILASGTDMQEEEKNEMKEIWSWSLHTSVHYIISAPIPCILLISLELTTPVLTTLQPITVTSDPIILVIKYFIG